MSPAALQHRREQWLQLHDQKTNGIMGLFPAVVDLPVRFTETTNKEKQIFKNTRGKLKGGVRAPPCHRSLATEECAAQPTLAQRPHEKLSSGSGAGWRRGQRKR